MSDQQKHIILEKFDELWGLYGDPVIVEKKLSELLPHAEQQNKSVYLQILSQIALAQALQKRFNDAHKTLDCAESMFVPGCELAHTRILLERGRVFQQAGQGAEALKYFMKSFELSSHNNYDYQTIDAAHMIAIASEKTEDKIHWNECALEMAQKTNDPRARMWLGSLSHNLGINYLEAMMYDKALTFFHQALEFRKAEGYQPNIRVAEWAIGKTLRLLGMLDDALAIQDGVLKKYQSASDSGNLECPEIIFTQLRGYVYEELAEIYLAKAQHYARRALKNLQDNEVVKATEIGKLERLNKIVKF